MQYHAATIQNVRAMCQELNGAPCAIMLDTKGPEIRSGKLVDGKDIKVEQGSTLTLKYFPDGQCLTPRETYSRDILLKCHIVIVKRLDRVNRSEGQSSLLTWRR